MTDVTAHTNGTRYPHIFTRCAKLLRIILRSNPAALFVTNGKQENSTGNIERAIQTETLKKENRRAACKLLSQIW